MVCYVFFPVENIKSLSAAMPRDVELDDNKNYTAAARNIS